MNTNPMNSVITIDPVYRDAGKAQSIILYDLGMMRDALKLQDSVWAFEDTMNGLSGALQGIDSGLLKNVRDVNGEIIVRGAAAGYTISLHESVLPIAQQTVTHEVTVPGKKLYPLTTSVVSTVTEVVAANVSHGTSSTVYPQAVIVEGDDTAVDPIFDELDLEAASVVETPTALDQNGGLPVLPAGMVTLSQKAAANANGLQAGLSAFSHNPLATIIDDTRSLLLYYTADNYANLNSALVIISADPLLNVEYKALREAIAGGDGLSGSVAQLDIFKDHTDRLAGLVLAEDSPNAEATGDSTDEFLNVNDISGNLQPIFSFDAKKFRSAKYMVQASAANTDRGHQATELYILHDNSLAYTREITSIYTQDPFVSFTTQFLNSKVTVLANTSADNTDFVIHGTKLRIARVSESFADMSQTKIVGFHESLQSYLDDGVDYVQKCSASLLHPETVADLAREFRDMIANLSTIGGSTAEKQTAILGYAVVMRLVRVAIQTSIDNDYANFVAVRKLTEALNIAETLTISYTDSTGNSIPSSTLNSSTISAIVAEQTV